MKISILILITFFSINSFFAQKKQSEDYRKWYYYHLKIDNKKGIQYLLTVDSLRIDSLNKLIVSKSLPYFYYERSMIYELVNDFDSAFNDINKAISLDSKESLFYYFRALLRAKTTTEPTVEEKEDIDTAIILNPKFAEAYSFKATHTLDNNKAIGYLSKAIEFKPDYAEAYVNRGQCYKALGFIDKACEDWIMSAKLGLKAGKAFAKNCNPYYDEE